MNQRRSVNPAVLSAEDEEILAYLQRQEASHETHRYQIAKCIGRQDYPLSSGQLGLWFQDQIEPGNPAYHFSFRLRFGGPFHYDALLSALNELMRRHDVLRARFVMRDLELVQIITPPASIELPFVDFSDVDRQTRERRAQELVFHLNQDPFDLSEGPLVRSLLLGLDVQDHLLMMCFHHIVTDRWSMNVFVRELETLYGAYSTGGSSPLEELPVQYTDYAIWEHESQQSDAFRISLKYWQSQLADLTTLALPMDRPRPAIRDFGSAKVTHRFPAELVGQLRHLAKTQGATMFMVYLTGVSLMLQRLSGQFDIAVGSPVTNRNLPELEALIGYFINTLVLRVDLSGEPSVSELLSRVRRMLLDAYRHQGVPFETLVEKLAPKRDLSLSPLFQVLFVHLGEISTSARETKARRNRPELSQPDKVSTDYDLEIYITDETDEASVAFHFRTDIFDEATIKRIIEYYERVLAAMASDPGQRIGAISLLGAEQCARVLAAGCGPSTTVPAECAHRLFEAQARRAPGATAVEAADGLLSYRELNGRSNRLARRLRELGAGPGIVVGVCMDRSVELLVSVLGVLKSGAAYVPLDAEFPQERLAFMVADAELAMVVTRGGLAKKVLPQIEATLLDVDAERAALESLDDGDLDGGASLEDLAYVIYTSGSTGRPKGVCIEHRALTNFALAAAQVLAVDSHDRLLGVASLSFDASVLDLYVPLMCGARVVLAERTIAADAIELARLIARSRASMMHATPATWQLLRSSGWGGDTGLRVLSGGEALPWPLAEWLAGTCASLVNLYGPTEATVYVSTAQVAGAGAGGGGEGVVGIGTALANSRIHVLDGALQPVPPGVVGELCIGGEQVARGYLNRTALTARQFVADPYSDKAAGRLYRTGDLARYHEDGGIEFIGRTDDQVKMRGFRIELGEVECVLAEDTSVEQALVVCREDVPGDQRLVAYVVARAGEVVESIELMNKLRERASAKLPWYMVPSAVVVLEALPLTPNRKVDRAALPAPREMAGPEARGADEAGTDLERMLMEVWRETLGIARVGVLDNFFDLGGHSLLVIRVIVEMRKRTGVALLAREYMMQNLRQIAGLYARDRSDAGAAARQGRPGSTDATHRDTGVAS